MSLFYIFAGVDTGLLFSVIFTRAFVIPARMKKFKKLVTNLVNSNNGVSNNNGMEKLVLNCWIESIPSVGIQVGSFDHFHKMSIPKFLGFAAKYIMKLLIALRKR